MAKSNKLDLYASSTDPRVTYQDDGTKPTLTDRNNKRYAGAEGFMAKYSDFFKKLGNVIDILGVVSSIYNQGKSQQAQQDQSQYQSKYADYSGLAQDALTARDNAIRYAENTKNNAYGVAKQAKDISYADAERLREKSIQDANRAYAYAQPTYGANAEALLSRGLTGSGYSDYIAGKAYATQRADIAAARETEAQSRRVADVRYADAISQANQQYANAEAEAKANYVDYINGLKGNVISDNAKFEQEARTAYSNLIGLAEEGASEAYINSYIAKYGDYYGWSDAEKKAIKDVVDDYKATYTLTVGGNGIDVVNNGSTVGTQPQTVQQAQQQNKQTVLDAIKSGDMSVMNNLDVLVQNGQLSEGDLPSIWKAAMLSEMGKAQTNESVDNILAEIDNHNLSDADKEEIRSLAEKKKTEIGNANQPKITGGEYEGLTEAEAFDKEMDKIAERTKNTSSSGTEYHWDRHIFALGGKPTITYSDGTTDQVYLKLYANSKAKKALGSGKEGEIKKYGDDYYVYDGTSSWIMLSGVDNGQKYHSGTY